MGLVRLSAKERKQYQERGDAKLQKMLQRQKHRQYRERRQGVFKDRVSGPFGCPPTQNGTFPGALTPSRRHLLSRPVLSEDT